MELSLSRAWSLEDQMFQPAFEKATSRMWGTYDKERKKEKKRERGKREEGRGKGEGGGREDKVHCEHDANAKTPSTYTI
jgi:hypothetical protein